MANKMRGLTTDSKSKTDFKELYPTKIYEDFASCPHHIEFYCKIHMKDRLLNYCHQDSLVDVIFSGLKELRFRKINAHDEIKCKNKQCGSFAEYRIDRIDRFD